MAVVGTEELGVLLAHFWRMSRVGRYCPLMIWGEAGVGKSDSVHVAAETLGIDFVDLRLANYEAPDLMGLMGDDTVYPCLFDLQDPDRDPIVTGERYSRSGLWHHCRVVHPDKIPAELREKPTEFVEWLIQKTQQAGYGVYFENRTVYSAPMWFPEPETSGILFIDEANRSQKDTRAGLFQLLLDRRIHELELPPGWIIVGACNPSGSMSSETFASYGDTEDITDRALLARWCHMVLSTSREEWLKWASKAGVDPTIWALINNDPSDRLLGLKAGLQIPAIDPTPRSFELLSGILQPIQVPGERTRQLEGRLRSVVTEGLLGMTWGARLSSWFDECDAKIGWNSRNIPRIAPEDVSILEAQMEVAVDLASAEDPSAEDVDVVLASTQAAIDAGMVDVAGKYASLFRRPGFQRAIAAPGFQPRVAPARDWILRWWQQ